MEYAITRYVCFVPVQSQEAVVKIWFDQTQSHAAPVVLGEQWGVYESWRDVVAVLESQFRARQPLPRVTDLYLCNTQRGGVQDPAIQILLHLEQFPRFLPERIEFHHTNERDRRRMQPIVDNAYARLARLKPNGEIEP